MVLLSEAEKEEQKWDSLEDQEVCVKIDLADMLLAELLGETV